jgi:hypothetical protein
MKAQRRHELQSNTLALWLAQAPDFFRKHGSRMLTGVLVVLLVLVVLRVYRARAQKTAAEARERLTVAEQVIQAVAQRPQGVSKLPVGPEEAASARKDIERVLQVAKDPKLIARAWVALGDSYWAVANYPDQPQQTVDESLRKAEEAYRMVMGDELKSQTLESVSARFGLAAVAENRAFALDQSGASRDAEAQWAAAREHYQAIIADAKAPKPLAEYARQRLARLEQLQQPIRIAPPRPRATMPTTADSIMGPLPPVPPLPTTGPATRPLTTRPATRP